MTTIALKLEAIKKDPFTFFKAQFEAYDRPVLTIAELNAIATVPLDDIGQQRVRDVFIFACYTGLSYIDVKQLKTEHIATGMDGEQWVFTRREKSGTAVKVPLLQTAKEILDKYSGRRYGADGDLVLPVYSNQKCNKYLKQPVTVRLTMASFGTELHFLQEGIPKGISFPGRQESVEN